MSSTKQWLQCVGIVIAIACASAAPSLHPDAGSGVLSQPGQAIRRFDGTVAAEARPTSRNTIRRKRDITILGMQNYVAPKSAIPDKNVLAYVTAMREYSEAAYLLLRRMREINETFGADALSSGIVNTLRNESEFKALKDSLMAGSFNPLLLIRSSASSEGRTSNKKWEGEIKDSLFYGFSKKAFESNIPWDNILYEPEDEFVDNELEKMFAKWDLGYSVAKFLWGQKIQRKETSLSSTITNLIKERLADLCVDESLRSTTTDYFELIGYLQKNETIFAKIEELQVSDELGTAIVSLMQFLSSLANGKNTINPYTKGSDIYNSIRKTLDFEMKYENLTDELEFFIRKFLKFLAFASEATKSETVEIVQPAYETVSSYFLDCESLDSDAIRRLTEYGLGLLSKYSQISKAYLKDE